jgi:K+-sensing histidine kinase KdpD
VFFIEGEVIVKKFNLVFSIELFGRCLVGVLGVAILTAIMGFSNLRAIGEAVIALLYLLPIVWSTTRWGQLVGVSTAIAAALSFDFFFIQPLYTFTVGNLEGWLILIIFLVVSILVVGRIQALLSQYKTREREAVILYELTASLVSLQSSEAIARSLTVQIQQLFQAAYVRIVLYDPGQTSGHIFSEPVDGNRHGKPDRILPITTQQGLIGEISIWKDKLPLPPMDDWLFQSFIRQTGLALERVSSS